MYLLKNRVNPEKKYHNNKNKMGFGASIPMSEFFALTILDLSDTVEVTVWCSVSLFSISDEIFRVLTSLERKISKLQKAPIRFMPYNNVLFFIKNVFIFYFSHCVPEETESCSCVVS